MRAGRAWRGDDDTTTQDLTLKMSTDGGAAWSTVHLVQRGCVSRPFPSWNRSILTDIYLCHACSYHEIEDGNGAPGGWA